MTATTKLIPVSCNKDCGGGCPLLAHVQDGRVVKITNNPLGSRYMTGCVRGFRMPREVYAPERLRTPLWRSGPRGSVRFEPISWNTALDRVAERLVDIKERYGTEAILKLGGSGSCRGALHNTSRLLSRFLGFFGGSTITHSSYSSAATSFVAPYVFGTSETGLDPQTLLASKLIILWGLNAVDLRFGCELPLCLREAKRAGIPIIVIDPRRTRTVSSLASQWVPVRPGTDSALMLAILYVWLSEDLVDQGFVQRYSVGMDQLAGYVRGETDGQSKTPIWAERICGTPAETIIELARRYAVTKPTALLPGLSIQRTYGGEDAAWLGAALQTATGNVGVRGGSSGGHIWGRLPTPCCGAIKAPFRGALPSIPVYRWPDAVLEGTAGGYPSDIRAIYNVGGNYVSQGSNVRKNMRAFAAVEFAICHDLFLTPTAQQCDVVLPVTSFMERNDIVFPGGNYLLYSNQAIEPLAGTRHDYDIFCALADRLGFGEAFSERRDEAAWLAHFVAQSDVPDYDEFRRTGLYMAADQQRVGLADFVADPVAHSLKTPSGKIELVSTEYARRTGYPAIPTCRVMPVEPGYPLMLVTPHPRHRTHSQRYNMSWCRQLEEQALWINPVDAEARGIADGQLAKVTSPRGEVRIKAKVTQEMMAGVVSLLEGVWPNLDEDGVDWAGAANVLTATEPTMPSHGSRTHSTWVQVAKL